MNKKNNHQESKEEIEALTDGQFLEMLKTKIKVGCIIIEDNKLKADCRWNDKDWDYSVSWDELVEIHKKYRKLEREDRLCQYCLKEETSEKENFCPPCWERFQKVWKN